MTKSLSNILKTSSNILSANSGGTGLTSVGNTGNVLTSTGSGWISSVPFSYTLPTANTITLGGVKVDGTTITANNGVISGAAQTKTISNKTGAYTVILSDLGKIINCTSNTFTVSLTSAATLGSGFNCTIWNTSNFAADTITISPASGTIDLRSTLILHCGEGLDIICDGTNWQTGSKKPMRGYSENITSSTIYRPNASGAYGSIAIGTGCDVSGTGSFGFGGNTLVQGIGSIALGGYYLGSTVVSASSNYATAIGLNSASNGSQVLTGAGAMALGGSYASGVDSFAAAIGDNTGSYGAIGANSVTIGYQANATGPNSKAIGNAALASGTGALAISTGNGTFGATASGAYSIAIGRLTTVSGELSTALGQGTVSGNYSVGIGFAYSVTADMGVALGAYANTNGIIGKISFGSANGYGGAALTGKTTLSAATTTTTTVVLTTNNSTAAATNQLIVATNQAMTFFGTLIAKQTASANMASYMFKGAIVNNGGTVSISSISIETIVDTIGLTTQPTFTADNTNKGLAVTSGAKSGTNIRWVCNIDSVEVTYA